MAACCCVVIHIGVLLVFMFTVQNVETCDCIMISVVSLQSSITQPFMLEFVYANCLIKIFQILCNDGDKC